MMGQLPVQQNALFYQFCLEKHIPGEHLLRQIDRFLDFDQTLSTLTPFIVIPADHRLILSLWSGCGYGIRSERRLCEEIRYNPARRWFCRSGLEAEVSDHSIFSWDRHGRWPD